MGMSFSTRWLLIWRCLNESPSEKEGKFPQWRHLQRRSSKRLNESPSEKEGK